MSRVLVAERLREPDLAALRLDQAGQRDRQAQHRDREDERRHDAGEDRVLADLLLEREVARLVGPRTTVATTP